MSAALLDNFDLFAASVGGVAKLRELILSLAVRGRLVPQDPNDEPASELLKRIRAEKERLIEEGKIKRDKPVPEIAEPEEPYELPDSWEWVRMATVGEIVGGGTPKSDNPENWAESGIPWLTPADLYGLKSKRIGKGKRDISEVGLANSSARLIPQGSVLFSSRAPIGYVAIAENNLATNQGFKSCVPTILDLSEFIYWFLKYAAKRIDAGASGTTFKEVSGAEVARILMPLPPLAEQSRIVAKVEELMALCDRLEAEQGHAAQVQGHWIEAALDQLAESANADEFRRHWQHLAAHFDTLFTTPESIDRLDATLLQLAVRGKLVPQDPNDEPARELLKQIRTEKDRLIKEGKVKRDKPLPPLSEDEKAYSLPIGWDWARLQDLALAGPTNGLSPRPSPTETDFRCLTLSATTKGRFRPEYFKFVEIDERTAQQFYLKQGDLLIQRGNSIDYVGISAIYDRPSDRFIYPDLMMRIQLTPSVDSRFVHRWLNCTFGRTYFMTNATGTQGTMPKVNQTTVAQTPVPLPPLAEQSRIVAEVEKLLVLTASLKARLTAAQTKQAHLAEALIAELTTATPDEPNAEVRFAKRAQHGHGQEAEGLTLLEKAAEQ